MDQRQTTYHLMKTFPSLMPLSIMMTPSLTIPPESLMFVPFSSLSTSKANGTTPSERLQPLILSLTSSATTPTILVGFSSMNFFLKEGRMRVETVHMFPMKQPTKETISEAKSFALLMNKGHTWEPRNVSNTPLATSTG